MKIKHTASSERARLMGRGFNGGSVKGAKQKRIEELLEQAKRDAQIVKDSQIKQSL